MGRRERERRQGERSTRRASARNYCTCIRRGLMRSTIGCMVQKTVSHTNCELVVGHLDDFFSDRVGAKSREDDEQNREQTIIFHAHGSP